MLRVEKLMINNIDSTNNFGSLRINELMGTVNIGTIYEGNFPKDMQKKLNEKLSKKIIDPSPFKKDR
ncbi:hypothetical protein [Neobacillus kokaensis]|uniref:Uncharacterized protein n=1 Tax=Neobacillus kokaensis TaxID=2759023 RepID=A0ABQ3N2J4_9BACI|nr:hypothetical protein [Neobacillus kokaensis]GHH98326.1 hypothetical protein AM1BK_18690 [Neobacillus kokaensis]